MRITTKIGRIVASCLAMGFLGQAAVAGLSLEYTPGKGAKIEYAEGKFFTVGADVRVRLTHVDRNVVWPEGPPTAALEGPALEWLRVRTRLKLGLDLWDGAKLSVRLVNRVHNVSSHFYNPNDIGSATWQYPDEIIADQVALTTTVPGIDGLSVTIGRQDFILGNGMVMLEGTPYDQGRTIYFDGISALYKTECDALKLFAFFNEAQDEFVVAGNEDRNLRRGDIFTTGLDWTHAFNKSLNSEVYYIYAHIHDTDVTAGERNFAKNGNGEIHTVGARLFGSPTEHMDYSVEVARQISEYQASPNPAVSSSGSVDGEGWMVDARLTLKDNQKCLKPSVMFEYTYFSGDDPDTTDYEGWDGIFAEYPIWREELLPILNNGNWTNLHQYRVEAKVQLHPKVTLTGTAAYLRADESDSSMGTAGGDGDHFGDLYSAFLDYKVNDYITISLEAAFFEAGDYWDTSADSNWLRIQTVFSF